MTELPEKIIDIDGESASVPAATAVASYDRATPEEKAEFASYVARKEEEEKAVVATDSASNFLSIIEKLAANPDVDVSKLESVLDMQERILAKQAEMEFNAALSRVAQKMPRITRSNSVGYKDKNDPNGKEVEAFRFASYEDIDKAVRPLLVAEGFSLSFDTDMKDGGGVIMHGTLSHIGGHSRVSSMPLALDNSGGKNNVQGMGSTVSYGKRYTMCMLLNIVTVGEDNDGQDQYLSNELAVEIDLLVTEAAADKEKFLKYMNAETVQSISAKDYKKAKSMLENKMRKQEVK